MVPKYQNRRAFSLVELLVVVGIIAVLIGMLLPALYRARYTARVTTCAARERQLLLALTAYSQTSDGYFLRIDGPPPGACNVHDMQWGWYNTMHTRLGVPNEAFFCPFTYENEYLSGVWNAGSFAYFGYGIWVPRNDTIMICPPDPPAAIVVGNKPIRGPASMFDPLRATNPVIADDIYLYTYVVNTGTAPAFNFSLAPPDDYFQQNSAHMYKGRVESSNEGFADGHVERVDVSAIKVRFMSGNAWNCW